MNELFYIISIIAIILIFFLLPNIVSKIYGVRLVEFKDGGFSVRHMESPFQIYYLCRYSNGELNMFSRKSCNKDRRFETGEEAINAYDIFHCNIKKSWKLSKYLKLPDAPVLDTIPCEEKLQHDKEIENHMKL